MTPSIAQPHTDENAPSTQVRGYALTPPASSFGRHICELLHRDSHFFLVALDD